MFTWDGGVGASFFKCLILMLTSDAELLRKKSRAGLHFSTKMTSGEIGYFGTGMEPSSK